MYSYFFGLGSGFLKVRWQRYEIELLFLGTGTSSSVPYLDCLTAPPHKKPCKTCLSTLNLEGKKNIRRNTSVALRVTGKDQKKNVSLDPLETIVIDVGKNFQAAAVEWFPKFGLREIDAILITHAHADAMNGLDDLRGWTLRNAIQECLDIYVSEDTFREVKRSFPYLVSKEFASGGGDVPDFKWHIIEDKVPFEIKDTGLWVTPFLVQHGRLFTNNAIPTFAPSPFTTQPATPLTSGRSSPRPTEGLVPEVQPYWCFGFMIQQSIVYMSDVSHIPEDAWTIIESGKRKSVLVVDCLRLRPHTSHMGIQEAATTIRRLDAERNYLIGFNHDLLHDEWVTIGKAVGYGPVENTADMTKPVYAGVKMIREGKVDGKGHWVRPSHDGLRVFMWRNGIVRDETYDEM
ncbi:beta-lactamase-like protein [Scleroderma citrinum]